MECSRSWLTAPQENLNVSPLWFALLSLFTTRTASTNDTWPLCLCLVAFELYDQDKDGKISREELLQVNTSTDTSKTLRDQNGVKTAKMLTYKEFVDVVRQQPC